MLALVAAKTTTTTKRPTTTKFIRHGRAPAIVPSQLDKDLSAAAKLYKPGDEKLDETLFDSS